MSRVEPIDAASAPAKSGKPSTLSEFKGGFPVVLTASLGSAFGIGGLAVYPLPYFMPAFEREFGWDRASVGYVATFVTFAVFLVAPWAGRLCDKLGVHRVTPVSIVLFALGFMALTQVRGSIWTLYIGAFIVAMLGCGTIYVCYSRAINTWFDTGRGLALGCMAAGSGLAAFVLPLILPPIIERFGWQAGFVTLGLLALSILPLALLFLREKPTPTTKDEDPKLGLSFRNVLRDHRFWLIAAGGLMVTTAVSGASLHFVPMWTDLGGERRAMEQAAAFYGLSLIAGRLLAGSLLDRLPGPVIAIGLFSIPAIMVLSPSFAGPGIAPLYAICVGLALAAETDLMAFMTSRYFGLKAFSQSYGWLYAVGALGFAGGPLFAGWAFKTFGDYDVARIVWAAMFAGGAILFGLLGRYPSMDELEAREQAG